MALPHARLLDVIDVCPMGDLLAQAVSTSLIKTQRVQILHLVMQSDQEQPVHHVADESVIHCLEGIVEVVCAGRVHRLLPGQLLVMPAKQPHALRARSRCGVLVSLLLHEGDAGDHGGATEANPSV